MGKFKQVVGFIRAVGDWLNELEGEAYVAGYEEGKAYAAMEKTDAEGAE